MADWARALGCQRSRGASGAEVALICWAVGLYSVRRGVQGMLSQSAVLASMCPSRLTWQRMVSNPQFTWQRRPAQDVLRPFLMGLESKSPKLASICLVSIQKLCGHGALSDDGVSSVAAALEQVSASTCASKPWRLQCS